MKKIFKSRSPLLKDKDAEIIGRELHKHFPEGKLKPQNVVTLARSKASPLHKYFEWDDSVASEKYRLHQARGLLIALYIQIEDAPQTRAYENVYLEKSQKYVSAERISESEDLTDQVIDAAFKEIEYWQLKYSSYKDTFEQIFSAIAEAQRRHHGQKGIRKTAGARGKNINSTSSDKIRKDHNRRRLAAVGK